MRLVGSCLSWGVCARSADCYLPGRVSLIRNSSHCNRLQREARLHHAPQAHALGYSVVSRKAAHALQLPAKKWSIFGCVPCGGILVCVLGPPGHLRCIEGGHCPVTAPASACQHPRWSAWRCQGCLAAPGAHTCWASPTAAWSPAACAQAVSTAIVALLQCLVQG